MNTLYLKFSMSDISPHLLHHVSFLVSSVFTRHCLQFVFKYVLLFLEHDKYTLCERTSRGLYSTQHQWWHHFATSRQYMI